MIRIMPCPSCDRKYGSYRALYQHIANDHGFPRWLVRCYEKNKKGQQCQRWMYHHQGNPHQYNSSEYPKDRPQYQLVDESNWV